MALLDASTPLQSIPVGSTATSTVATVLDNTRSMANHTMISTASAGVAAGAVQLQISHDNVNWLNAGAAVTLTASTVQTASVVAAAQYVRAVISTLVTGGTVGVTVASA